MIKEIIFKKLEAFLIVLNIICLIFYIFIRFNATVKHYACFLYAKNKVHKNEVIQSSFFEEKHPDCYLTKESLSNVKKCSKNNGIWSFKYKTCFCKITYAS